MYCEEGSSEAVQCDKIAILASTLVGLGTSTVTKAQARLCKYADLSEYSLLT